MRKVVLSELLSLDGVAEDPNKFFFDWDEVVDADSAALIASQDAVLLGRRSYDEWSEFWPDSDIEPFATFINDVPKYVATSTPLGRHWHNATAIEGGLVEFVQNLKNSSGGDIGVHASISVPKRCSQRTPSTKYGSPSHRRSLAVGDGSWTDCRRFASNCSVA
jgi:dihydrofolate reductase